VNNGDQIYAVDSGIVNWAGYSTWGYGNLVIINHGHHKTYYAHLGEVYVSCGQYVRRGKVVATVDNRLGKQGASVNPHLHFEYRRGEYNYSPWLMLQKPVQEELGKPSSGMGSVVTQ
jgi:murein DD-endopeptidase MepM/ murein hydrolase activator NlpD